MRVSRRSTSSKAKAAPGVLLVLTGADAAADKLGAYTAAMMPEDIGAPKGHRIHQQLLQAEKVRFVGDRVAFVVAETEAQARDAAEMIEVDYETLPAVALLEDAAKDGAPKVWDDNPNGNVAFVLGVRRRGGDRRGIRQAKHVVKLRMENNRITPVSMEPRTSIGDYNAADDHYTLYTSSQNPHGVRMEIAHSCMSPENQMRVVAPDVGGGFGLKGGSFPDDALVLWASKKLRRPVKWVATRSESMMNDHTGRDLVSYGELALDENGKILAIRSQSLFQIGAYFVGPGMVTGLFSLRFIPGSLRRADDAHRVQGPVHQHAAGRPLSRRRPPGGGLLHRAHDRARREADRHGRRGDPPPQPDRAGQIPLQHADALHLRLGRVRAAARQVRRDDRLEGLREAPQGLREGTASCAAARSATTSSSAASSTTAWTSASIRAAPSRCSAARIRTGRGTRPCSRSWCTSSSACRSRTSATCRATPRRCSSAAAPTGRAAPWSAAARSSVAADAIIEKAKPMAAAMMEADAGDIEFKDGSFKVAGTDKAIPLTEVAKASYRADGADDQVRHRAGRRRARIRPSRRAIRTARMRSRSRSIRRPAR